MAETWGALPKAQDDNTKIDDAIDNAVVAHLADPDAHVEAGQSLNSHKAAEIIDHLAGSIVEDKFATGCVSSRAITAEQVVGKDIRTASDVGADVDGVLMNSDGIQMWQDGDKKVDVPVSGNPIFKGNLAVRTLSFLRQTWMLPFESVDAYIKSTPGNSLIEPLIQALRITQADTSGYITSMYVGEVYNIVLQWSKNPSIEFSMVSGDVWGQDVYVLWGTDSPYGVQPGSSFGFKINHSTSKIYACSRLSGGSESVNELTGIDPEVPHLYRAEVIGGGTGIEFYVDGVLVYTKTLAGTTQSTDYLFTITIKSFTGENHETFIWNMSIQQDI